MPTTSTPSTAHTGVRGVDRGSHYAFFGGRIIIGPDWRALLGTTLLITAPCVIFLIFVAPYLGEHISWAIVAVSCLIIVFDLLMLFRTAFMDPGFYPRSSPNVDIESGLRPSTKDYSINGYVVTTKYCATCCHYRPPRCSHCAVCDNCVDKFDHHCPWVGTCVGRRNYRPFMAFVLTTTLLCMWVFAMSILQLWHAATSTKGTMSAAFGAYPASIVLVIYVFVFFWFVGGLSALHLVLISKNMTTYEHFRHRYTTTGNPYSKGCFKNCGEAFCSTTPPRPAPLGEKTAIATTTTPAQQTNNTNTSIAATATADGVDSAVLPAFAGINGLNSPQPKKKQQQQDTIELTNTSSLSRQGVAPTTADTTTAIGNGTAVVPFTHGPGSHAVRNLTDRHRHNNGDNSDVDSPIYTDDNDSDDDGSGDPGRFVVHQGTAWSVDTRVDADGSMVDSIDSPPYSPPYNDTYNSGDNGDSDYILNTAATTLTAPHAAAGVSTSEGPLLPQEQQSNQNVVGLDRIVIESGGNMISSSSAVAVNESDEELGEVEIERASSLSPPRELMSPRAVPR